MVFGWAGNFVKDETWHAFIVVISNAAELQGYTVRALYKAIQTSTGQESFVRVAVWCIGEYGEMSVNNIGMLDIEDPITMVDNSIRKKWNPCVSVQACNWHNFFFLLLWILFFIAHARNWGKFWNIICLTCKDLEHTIRYRSKPPAELMQSWQYYVLSAKTIEETAVEI